MMSRNLQSLFFKFQVHRVKHVAKVLGENV